MKKYNNEGKVIVKSSIVKEVYNHNFKIKKGNSIIIIINVVCYKDYSELSFEILDFWLSWTERKLIRESINCISGRVKVTEIINREYYLRVWLKYLGFKESVFLPNYFKVNDKNYHYIISAYN